jgi:SAM-dependent methyltransferase
LTDSIAELEARWLEGFDRDPRRVIYERLYEILYSRFCRDESVCSLLDVGSGYGRVIEVFGGRGWDVMALELFPSIADRLRMRLAEKGLQAQVEVGSIVDLRVSRRFDLATMVMMTQCLSPGQLRLALKNLRVLTRRLVLDVTNAASVYGKWIGLRGWRNGGSWYYTPAQIEQALAEAGFQIDYVRGIGFVSPLSLFGDFKGMVVPPLAARLFGFLDQVFPRWCHLYYLECF